MGDANSLLEGLGVLIRWGEGSRVLWCSRGALDGTAGDLGATCGRDGELAVGLALAYYGLAALRQVWRDEMRWHGMAWWTGAWQMGFPRRAVAALDALCCRGRRFAGARRVRSESRAASH